MRIALLLAPIFLAAAPAAAQSVRERPPVSNVRVHAPEAPRAGTTWEDHDDASDPYAGGYPDYDRYGAYEDYAPRDGHDREAREERYEERFERYGSRDLDYDRDYPYDYRYGRGSAPMRYMVTETITTVTEPSTARLVYRAAPKARRAPVRANKSRRVARRVK